MKKVLGLAVTAAMVLSVVISSVASAAPIVCSPGQTATKDYSGNWYCKNGGGNDTNAEWPQQGSNSKFR